MQRPDREARRQQRRQQTNSERPAVARLRFAWSDVPLARTARSAALCVALWCVLYAPGLLPAHLAALHGLWITIGLGVVLALVRFDRFLPAIVIVATACVVTVASTPLTAAIARWWIRDDVMPPGGVSAIIPLSGTVNNEGAISAEAVDHLITALALTAEGKAHVLVTTTVQQEFPTGVVTSTTDQARLITLFGRQIEWLRTPIVRTTRDEAVAAANLLVPRGLRQIAVVASPMHTRRACAAFEAVGFQVTCVVSRTSVPGGRNPPDAPRDRLNSFGDWLYEAIAMLEYRMRGWVGSTSHAA
jgi:uncharacterized SAM-binding protein YcdF (DUF218 family)